MQLKPLPHYFIVKIEIEKQKEFKEKVGSLYVHHAHAHMQRNIQEGYVVSIGSEAHKKFPQAKVNDILIFHHFVESQNMNTSNFIASDNIYNYYIVTASEYNGHRNESYGVFQNGKIIPHPDFLFLEYEEKVKEISEDEFIEKSTEQVGSLFLFKNWEDSRESKEEKSKILLEEIKNQSKGKSMKEDAKRALEVKQYEAEKITQSLNHKKYLPYKLVACNPSFNKKFNKHIESGNKIYALGIAAETTVNFREMTYIVLASKYVAAVA